MYGNKLFLLYICAVHKNRIMKVKMIINGTQQIVMIPENDLEKLFLKEFSKMPTINTTLIGKQTPILNEIIHDGLVIGTAKAKISESCNKT